MLRVGRGTIEGSTGMNGYQKKRVLGALDFVDDGGNLTAWEYDFINNLADNFGEKPLSKAQSHHLNVISQKTKR